MDKQYYRRQKGGAMIEAAIVIPVALILILGLVDLGRALNQYIYTVRVSYEGARLIAEQRNLSLGCLGDGEGCITPPAGSPYWLAVGRMRRLLVSQGFDTSDVSYKLNVNRIDNQYVRINTALRVKFNPFFSLTPIDNLEVNMSAPFLFPDNTELTALQN